MPMSSSQSINSLSAPLPVVINTRPVERAAPLTCHLQAAGFTVVDIPMLSLQPRSVADADIAIMRDWLAGAYQALVIVSPTAAASGLAVWQALECDNKTKDINNKPVIDVTKAPSHLIAVGEATAAVLKEAALSSALSDSAALPTASYDVLQPMIANNEGMLAMPEIENLQAGDKLLVWRGLGGRRLLVDTLQARGVHIDSIAWYERTMPVAASVQYQQWRQQFKAVSKLHLAQPQSSQPPKPIVIISSGTAFEHWQSVVEQAQSIGMESDSNPNAIAPLTIADFSYVVLGVRLANMVATHQLSYWRVEDLAPDTILAAIQSSTRLIEL
ncbi:uroporphyrinogen-III synthase [Psychrobacter frigidicola]|uniref:Uroporphyrinogen-III synthase n=2 Tax=Psychrobacter frigidicola TaxID=45611 RepID=A0A5C7A3R0_9GAMM|nr:uroporphyrinogen-III synthase [Psychrobacter frigidicola]